MTHWIAQLEVEAEAVLPEGAPPFEYTDPRGEFRVKLLNRAVRPVAETPLLEMQLEFDAPNLVSADNRVKPLARQFLHWLSLVTCCGFRARRVERLIDWTPGLFVREQFVYHTDRTDMPPPALVQGLASTISLWNAKEVPDEVRRAIRWFAKGVTSELPDEQFHCFFFAIEILAEFRKAPAPVPDQCPKCNGALFCPHCNEVPTHRPYARQAIKALLAACMAEGSEAAFTALNQTRSRVMHGRHSDELEKELPLPFEELVDRAGRIAWACIVNSLKVPPGTHTLELLQASTFLHRTLTLKVHAEIGGGGDLQHPRLEDQGRMDISVVPGKSEAAKKPTDTA